MMSVYVFMCGMCYHRDGPSSAICGTPGEISVHTSSSITDTHVDLIMQVSPSPSQASLPVPRTPKSKSVRMTSKSPPLFISRYPDDKVASVQLHEDLAAQCDGVLYVDKSYVHPLSLGLFTAIDIDPLHPAFQPLAEVWGLCPKHL